MRTEIASDGRRVGDALDAYEGDMRRRQKRPRTIKVAISAIGHFLDRDRALADVGVSYLKERITVRLAGHAPQTVATELRQAKTFLRWCGSQGWASADVVGRLGSVVVDVSGDRGEGKEQLTIDEARLYLESCRLRAEQGAEGAVAAASVLLLGVRAREILDRQVRDLDDGGRLLWIRRAKTERGNRRVEVPEPLRQWMLRQAAGREPGDLLFGSPKGPARSTSWLANWVHRMCRESHVRQVCAHSMRGLHATLAEAAGATPHVVAASLGHTTPQVTGRHYTLPDVRQRASQRAALTVLAGGARG